MKSFAAIKTPDLPPVHLAGPNYPPSTNEIIHWSGRMTHATVPAGSALWF